ncbi:hypothetical protein ABZ379_06995 [Streptomyces canus]|uniref:hypothetical protein n=1 Tax=Streptomyces canus TaxID=58343 RepID=UPI00340F3B5B
MSGEVKAAIIGLIGVVVGAGLSIFGAWLQQRGQTKTARQERLEIRGTTIGETALNELIVARNSLQVALEGDGSTSDALAATREAVGRAETAALTLPNVNALHMRMADVFKLYSARGWVGAVRGSFRVTWQLNTTIESIEILAAFLRGDPLPAPSSWFVQSQRKVEEADATRAARALTAEADRKGAAPS